VALDEKFTRDEFEPIGGDFVDEFELFGIELDFEWVVDFLDDLEPFEPFDAGAPTWLL